MMTAATMTRTQTKDPTAHPEQIRNSGNNGARKREAAILFAASLFYYLDQLTLSKTGRNVGPDSQPSGYTEKGAAPLREQHLC